MIQIKLDENRNNREKVVRENHGWKEKVTKLDEMLLIYYSKLKYTINDEGKKEKKTQPAHTSKKTTLLISKFWGFILSCSL